MAAFETVTVETDLLICGGGMAACGAAVEASYWAKQHGLKVTLVDKAAVDQMVRDAQEHAEEDRKRREEVETRNQAEQLTYQAEKTLKDLGDKVAAEDRAEVETTERLPFGVWGRVSEPGVVRLGDAVELA